MKTLTITEATDWCSKQGIALHQGQPVFEGDHEGRLRTSVPQSLSRVTWFCELIERTLRPRDHCLLWVSAWGIWPSSENWHLYYALRRAYGDARLLEEAPGHLFLNYESHDLVSFLELGLLFGWDMHVLPSGGYGRAFISHDEWTEIELVDRSALAALAAELSGGKLQPQIPGAILR